MTAISLPYPVSTNRLTRFGGGRAYLSPKARQWKQQVAAIAKQAGVEPSAMPMIVSITMHPKANKDGSCSKVKPDIDNVIKCALDGLNGIAWVDDAMIIRITAQYGQHMPGGGLTVAWIES